MWVRSQNKDSLIKCNAFTISHSKGTSYSKESYNLIGSHGNEDYYLGTYEEKSSAVNCIDGLYQRMMRSTTGDIPYQID